MSRTMCDERAKKKGHESAENHEKASNTFKLSFYLQRQKACVNDFFFFSFFCAFSIHGEKSTHQVHSVPPKIKY